MLCGVSSTIKNSAEKYPVIVKSCGAFSIGVSLYETFMIDLSSGILVHKNFAMLFVNLYTPPADSIFEAVNPAGMRSFNLENPVWFPFVIETVTMYSLPFFSMVLIPDTSVFWIRLFSTLAVVLVEFVSSDTVNVIGSIVSDFLSSPSK